MRFSLNSAQAKSLSGFFFDIAKGSLLAALGFTVALSSAFLVRLIFLIANTAIAILFLYIGLSLLKEIKE